VRSGLLLGHRHLELGAIGAIAEGRTAIALCCGGAPKTYFHTDPNEDSVCFAAGEGGLLAAVADGHHGFAGSECAVEYLLEAHAEAWTAAEPPFDSKLDWTQAAYAALAGANQAILEQAAERRLPPSHTTLSLALVRPDRDWLVHASMGDSHIFQATEHTIHELGWNALGSERTYYLGYEPMDPYAPTEREKQVVSCEPLAGTSALVLATDGLSEHRIGVEDPRAAVREALAAVGESPPELRPLHACKRVTETALAAHRRNRSGDNVACAVLWLVD
jgi:serine/threonine protein phosphatase PrpC